MTKSHLRILLGIIIMVTLLSIPQLANAGEATASEATELTTKTVEDVLIASIRYRGQFEEMPTYFLNLFAHAWSYMNGPPLALYYDAGTEEGYDIEVCVPVSDTVETSEIKTRLLEGGKFLTTLYYGDGETLYGQNLSKTWDDRLLAYVGKNNIPVAPPLREIHMEWNPNNPENVIEMQIQLVGE
jgi:effector-binding domain-containing protein